MISTDGREANLLPQAAPWRCIHELAHVAFQAERRCDGTVSKDLVSKDTTTKELIKPVVTQEVAQVSKVRSGGSAQVKV